MIKITGKSSIRKHCKMLRKNVINLDLLLVWSSKGMVPITSSFIVLFSHLTWYWSEMLCCWRWFLSKSDCASLTTLKSYNRRWLKGIVYEFPLAHARPLWGGHCYIWVLHWKELDFSGWLMWPSGGRVVNMRPLTEGYSTSGWSMPHNLKIVTIVQLRCLWTTRNRACSGASHCLNAFSRLIGFTSTEIRKTCARECADKCVWSR